MKNIFDKEKIIICVKQSFSYADVIRKMGWKQSGSIQHKLVKWIEDNNINVSHFTGQLWNKGKTSIQDNRLTKLNVDDIFSESSIASVTYVRKLVKQNKLIPYECECCKITSWNGKSITLQLDHKNGKRTDNRLTNLRYLCPNCHSQTETFCSKNRKRKDFTDEEIIKSSVDCKNLNEVRKKLGCNERIYPRLKKVLPNLIRS